MSIFGRNRRCSCCGFDLNKVTVLGGSAIAKCPICQTDISDHAIATNAHPNRNGEDQVQDSPSSAVADTTTHTDTENKEEDQAASSELFKAWVYHPNDREKMSALVIETGKEENWPEERVAEINAKILAGDYRVERGCGGGVLEGVFRIIVEADKKSQPPSEPVPTMKPNWKELKRVDYRFKITHPQDWMAEYTQQGVEILPDTNPSVFDADLKRNVASPSVNITLVDVPDEIDDAVTQFIKVRPDGYNGYKHVKKYPCNISKATYAASYEFQYNASQIQFTALSLIVQKGKRMFNVTASGRSEDFEKFRSVISDIVFSFDLLE